MPTIFALLLATALAAAPNSSTRQAPSASKSPAESGKPQPKPAIGAASASGVERRSLAGLTVEERVNRVVAPNVFEVVLVKPPDTGISYERPLPYDLIPYAQRVDRHHSIGSAFAIGRDTLVSAAHVLNMGYNSQFGEPRLRDRDGRIYRLGRILKYSNHRDFVLFTAESLVAARPLVPGPSEEIGQRVWAVGNAHGEGIIQRDGLLTSRTPEEEEGEWMWLRFSAAASPGNSGGPLVDGQGRAIGIVLRKSENENLNYALPLSEVLAAPRDSAVYHIKSRYQLYNAGDLDVAGRLDRGARLPLSYARLDSMLFSWYRAYCTSQAQQFQLEHADVLFPQGRSSRLLGDPAGDAFPHLFGLGEDGSWDEYQAQDIRTSDLEGNGFLKYGTLFGSTLVFLQKPDTLPLARLLDDSRRQMDLLLKGIPVYRPFGGRSIRITSLGDATTDSIHVDRYGRKWQVRTWPMPFSDYKVLGLFLPTPNGFVALFTNEQTVRVDGDIGQDMRILAGYAHLAYYGTLREWSEYLALDRQILPLAFGSISLSWQPDKEVVYASKRHRVRLTPDLLAITADSDLRLRFGYLSRGDSASWEVLGVTFGENRRNENSLMLTRVVHPADDLHDSYLANWERVARQTSPWDEKPWTAESMTQVAGVHPRDARRSLKDRLASDHMHTVSARFEGQLSSSEMRRLLRRFAEAVTILE